MRGSSFSGMSNPGSRELGLVTTIPAVFFTTSGYYEGEVTSMSDDVLQTLE